MYKNSVFLPSFPSFSCGLREIYIPLLRCLYSRHKTMTERIPSVTSEKTWNPVNLLAAPYSVKGSTLKNQGTVGCFIRLHSQLYGLTSYHVLFGKHSPSYVYNYLAETTLVEVVDGNNKRIFGKTTPVFNAALDYALFKITSEQELTGLVTMEAPTEPRIGMYIHKTGALTATTHGIIHESSHLSEALVIIDKNELYPAETLCDYGDSGSLWLFTDENRLTHPVALHAGTSFHQHSLGRAYSFSAIFSDIRLHLHL